MEAGERRRGGEVERQVLRSRVAGLTASLDRMYTDHLSGLLPEEDFRRILGRIKLEREQLEEKLRELEQREESPVSPRDRAGELVGRFMETAWESRELLVSLMERVELTEEKEILLKFRFPEPEAIS